MVDAAVVLARRAALDRHSITTTVDFASTI